MYARFVKNNMEMKMALEQEQDEDKKGHARVRSKRNIFGSIISSLTVLQQVRVHASAQDGYKVN